MDELHKEQKELLEKLKNSKDEKETEEIIESTLKYMDFLHHRMLTDPLTHLYNRRKFRMDIEKEIHRAEHEGYNTSLIFFDIDHLKELNDKKGHQYGDWVLVMVGKVLQSSLHDYDKVYRMGGDEFAIIIPDSSLGEAEAALKRLKEKIKSEINITISAGLANYKESTKSVKDLFKITDQALYKSKNEGRDRITVCYPEKKKSSAVIE